MNWKVRFAYAPASWSENSACPFLVFKVLLLCLPPEVLPNLFMKILGIAPHSDINKRAIQAIASSKVPSNPRKLTGMTGIGKEFSDQPFFILDNSCFSPILKKRFNLVGPDFPMNKYDNHSDGSQMTVVEIDATVRYDVKHHT